MSAAEIHYQAENDVAYFTKNLRQEEILDVFEDYLTHVQRLFGRMN